MYCIYLNHHIHRNSSIRKKVESKSYIIISECVEILFVIRIEPTYHYRRLLFYVVTIVIAIVMYFLFRTHPPLLRVDLLDGCPILLRIIPQIINVSAFVWWQRSIHPKYILSKEEDTSNNKLSIVTIITDGRYRCESKNQKSTRKYIYLCIHSQHQSSIVRSHPYLFIIIIAIYIARRQNKLLKRTKDDSFCRIRSQDERVVRLDSNT